MKVYCHHQGTIHQANKLPMEELFTSFDVKSGVKLCHALKLILTSEKMQRTMLETDG